MAAGSALRLQRHNEQERENEKQNKLVRKITQDTYPDMGIRGFAPGFPEPPEGFCDGPSVEPLVGPELLGAWVDEASRFLFTVEAVWPQVLMPDDGALVSGVDITGPPTDEVRGDRAHVRGATDVVGGTPGLADPLFEGPSRALPSTRSSSPSTGAEAALDTLEVDPPSTGRCRHRTSGRCAREVAVSYRDPSSLSSLSSSSSSEAVLEGDSSLGRPSSLCWR
jgi:hypothetical protein